MNYIKSIFSTSDQKSPLSFDSKPTLPVENVQPSSANVITLKQDLGSVTGVSGSKQHTFIDTVADTASHAGTIIKYYVTRVVPLEEGDCLSCKLIGTTVLWGAAGFVVVQGIRTRIKYTGFRKVAYSVHIGFLSSGLFVLGLARLLDKSIFEKDKGNKKSIMELALSDLESVQQILKTSRKDKTREQPGD